MHRYQLIIEYVGTGFKGWQIQRKNITVQGTIQKTISKVIHEKIKLYGSGRTDTNVHATAQSAHFDTINEIKKLKKFLNSLNYFLNKKNISILSVKKKTPLFPCKIFSKKKNL